MRLAWDERRARRHKERNGNWPARLGELHGVVLLRKGDGDGWLREGGEGESGALEDGM